MIFAAFVGLFLCVLYDILKHQPSRLGYFSLFGAAMGVALFRKNGIYLLLFTAAYIAFIKNVKKRVLLQVITVVVSLNFLIEGSIASVLGIAIDSPREMLSLPIQQMARVKRNITDLDENMENEIERFFKETDIMISDNGKSTFNSNYFYNHKLQFARLII